MENGPFEDAFPIEHGDVPGSYFSFREGIYPYTSIGIQRPAEMAFGPPQNMSKRPNLRRYDERCLGIYCIAVEVNGCFWFPS